MSDQVLIMGKVRPFWGRILLMDSAATEEQTASGLIVPVQDEDPELTRAVVVQHDPHFMDSPSGLGYPSIDIIPVGSVVWYRTELGKRVGDVVVVDPDDIWAYEAS